MEGMSNQGCQPPQNTNPPQAWPVNPAAAQGPYVPGQSGARPQGQPYPGQPGYEPSGPAAQLGYSGHPGSPGPLPPPPNPGGHRSSLPVVLIAGGAAVAIVLALAMVLFGLRARTSATTPAPATVAPASPVAETTQSSAPASPSTTAEPGSDESLSSDYVSLTAPDGWAKAADSGDGNEIKIVDTADATSDITVYLLSPHRNGNLATVCKTEMDVLKIWVPGEISKLPDRTIGGKKAVGYALAGDKQHVMYCIAHAGEVFTINSEAATDKADRVASVYDAVVASVAWKS